MTDLALTGTALPVQGGALAPDVLDAILAGIPKNTRRAYQADWDRFTGWCAVAGHTPVPATAQTLADYEYHLAYEWIAPRKAIRPGSGTLPRGMAPATIQRNRAAIIKIHRLAQIPPPATDLAVDVLRGYKDRLAATRDSRAQQHKASAAHVEDLTTITAIPARTPLATIRNRAMLLLGYAIGARASELVFLNIENITSLPIGLSVSVYRSKTRRHDDVVIQTRHAPETVTAITEWLTALQGNGRTKGPLFVHVSKSGRIVARVRANGEPFGDPEGRLSPENASKVLTEILRKNAGAAKVPGQWSAHSLRRSMATNSRAAGHDNISIARQGGWSPNSATLAGYMDDAEKWGDDNALRGAGI